MYLLNIASGVWFIPKIHFIKPGCLGPRSLTMQNYGLYVTLFNVELTCI